MSDLYAARQRHRQLALLHSQSLMLTARIQGMQRMLLPPPLPVGILQGAKGFVTLSSMLDWDDPAYQKASARLGRILDRLYVRNARRGLRVAPARRAMRDIEARLSEGEWVEDWQI